MSSRSAIGLNIGGTCVRAAEVSTGRSGVRLERLGQVPLPAGAVVDGEVLDCDAVAAAIKSLWKSLRLKGKRVVLGVSTHRAIVRQVDLAPMSAQERRASLKFQVADLIPMHMDEAVLDFIPLGTVDKGGQAMERGLLIAVPQDTVLAMISAVRTAGLEPAQVDLTPLAVLRSSAVAGRADSAWGPEAVIDIGARTSTVVVHENGVPGFVRVLMLGAESITDALVEGAGLTPHEASIARISPDVQFRSGIEPHIVGRVLNQALATLVDELRGSVDYYLATTTGSALSRVVLTGGGSLVPQVAERLSAAVRSPVVAAAPFASLDTSASGLTADQVRFMEPLSAVPVGLALAGAR